MFCCSVCNINFNGIYPECVFTTPCGHLFHSECILLCLNKLSKCPFCTLQIEKRQLIKLHFQIDRNWQQQMLTTFKAKENESIINLDETNATLDASSVSLDDTIHLPVS